MGLRALLPVAIVLGTVGVGNADEPPPEINAAIKQAAAAGKPLLLEFHADWCGPCKTFAQRTLPAAPVQEALRGVVFVRYDTDSDVGAAAEELYDVTTLPTFIVVDKFGVERARREGAYLGKEGVDEFVKLIASSRSLAMDEETVRAKVKATPTDIAGRLEAARWFASRKFRADALTNFDAVASSKAATRIQRADATAAAVQIRRVDVWRAQVLAEKVALVRADPLFASADDIAIATVGSGISDKERKELVQGALGPKTDTSVLNDRIYIALAAGENDLALETAKRIVALERSAQYLDTLAECYYARGDRKKAIEIEDEAVELARVKAFADASEAHTRTNTNDERVLKANRVRFLDTKPHVAAHDVRQWRLRTVEFWTRLEKIDVLSEHETDPIEEAAAKSERLEFTRWLQAREALAKKLAKTCSKEAGSSRNAVATIVVDQDGKISSSTVLTEQSVAKELGDCLTRSLVGGRLPPRPRVSYDPPLTIRFDES